MHPGIVVEYVKRHAVLVLIAIIGFVGIGIQGEQALHALALCVAAEAVALSLSWLALWVYTNVNFISNRNTDVIARVFQAVHILVGLTLLGAFVVFAERN